MTALEVVVVLALVEAATPLVEAATPLVTLVVSIAPTSAAAVVLRRMVALFIGIVIIVETVPAATAAAASECARVHPPVVAVSNGDGRQQYRGHAHKHWIEMFHG